MQERRKTARTRSFLEGKILLNDRRSVIDCVIRNLSNTGACLQVTSLVGIPGEFDLQIDHEPASRPCIAVWRAQNRIGIEFRSQLSAGAESGPESTDAARSDRSAADGHIDSTDMLRSELLSLRSALNEVPFGIVLLDTELRAQF